MKEIKIILICEPIKYKKKIHVTITLPVELPTNPKSFPQTMFERSPSGKTGSNALKDSMICKDMTGIQQDFYSKHLYHPYLHFFGIV
jgi:hypothetical protein